MKTYRNQAQPILQSTMYEYLEEGSETIPDQALSVREILHRYTSGQTLDINNHTPVYLTNVPLYDTRRKSNIDLGVDKLNHEKDLHSLGKKIGDNRTALAELDRLEKFKEENPTNSNQKEQSASE